MAATFRVKRGITSMPVLEVLEHRTLLSAVPFNITVNDPNHEFAPFPDLSAAVPTAQATLSSLFDGVGSVSVEIVPADQSNRIGGEERGGGGTVSVVTVGQNGGYTVVEPGAEDRANTGTAIDGQGPDVVVYFDPTSYLPTVATGPDGVANMVYRIEHETLHGLGFTGYRTISGASYGQIEGSTETVYDSLTEFGAGGDPSVLYFIGPHAEAVYGGPVPLTSLGADDTTGENFYHVANPPGQPGSSLLSDLMNGIAFQDNPPSMIDLAILEDLGWSVLPQAFQNAANSQSSQGSQGGSPSPAAPRVLGIVATYRHRSIDAIVISFSEAMNARDVQELSGYSVTLEREVHRQYQFNKKAPIRSAVYSATDQSVTLTLSRPRSGVIQLALNPATIIASDGLRLSEGEIVRLG